ncbi:MAG: hypothetical protein NTY53_16780 [Kiritimatiellaeota bacterium]|nr:hypothetical protein [Kiritimatiellota bacterium]
MKTRKKKSAVSSQKAASRTQRPAKSPSRRSNAHSRATRIARGARLAAALARVAKGRPTVERCSETLTLAKRLEGFLVDVMNGGGHKDTLHKWRLTWAEDVCPRLLKGDRYDAEFAASYESAKHGGELWRDRLIEDKAFVMVMEGREEPLFQGGRFCGIFPRFNDQLHMLMLKASNPAKYADRHELGGPGGESLVPGIIVLPPPVEPPKG